ILPQIGPADENLSKGYKGRVIIGKYRLFEGEKLSTILKALEWLDLSNTNTTWPANRNFELGQQENEETRANALHELGKHLDIVMKVVHAKKASHLGFLALLSDGNGNFWFKPMKSFTEALTQSLASIEQLVDYARQNDLDSTLKERIGFLYRRFNDFILRG
ncbi:MAG: hypothetical protein N3A02_05055, partial [Rectinema sp.]|nr:hypothetical protein [Rectinema sp.]